MLGLGLNDPDFKVAESELESDSELSENKFETTPVDLESFLYKPEYLNLSMRLSSYQLEFVDA